jgi:hypothetical protein
VPQALYGNQKGNAMNSNQTANNIRQESKPSKSYGIDQSQSGHQVHDWQMQNIIPTILSTRDCPHIFILEPLQPGQD